MLLHKWENVLIFLFFIPPLFVLFIVVFPCLWSFAFYFVKFLEIKNIYKILIIFSILTLILFSAYYAYYFTEIGWLFGPLFAAGLVAVPFYLWMWYKIEKEVKDNALIQRMLTLQDYFNKNKKRFITHKKMFFIGLFSVFISIWQIEVPQRIVFESLIEAKVILSDRDYVVLEDKNNFGRTDNIAEGKWEDYVDLFGIISFSKKDFYACDTIDCKGKKKKIGEIHSSSISESTLHCAFKLGGGCGLINASKSDSYSLLEYLKQNQNKQINKQGENNVTK